MILRSGDICTFNKFECRVKSVCENTGKIEISYAVFLPDGTKIFDDSDTKFVVPNRVKLVARLDPSSTPLRKGYEEESLPSFSVRQIRWERQQRDTDPTGLVGSTNASTIDLTGCEDSQIFKKKKKKKLSYLSSSSSSSSSSSASTPPLVAPREKPRIAKRRSPKPKYDDLTNPVVPDWLIDEESDEEDSALNSEEDDDYSQEHSEMQRRARELEAKADRGYKRLNDEVAFEWDRRKQKIKQPFIQSDDEEIIAPKKKKNSIEEILPLFSLKNDSSLQTIKCVAEYIDSIHSPISEISQITDIVQAGMALLVPSANVASEVRLWLTSPQLVFKSINGWVAAIQMSFFLTWELKKNLFPEFSARILDKAISAKMQWAFLIASLTAEWFPLCVSHTMCAQMFSEYTKAGDESKRIIEKTLDMLITKQDFIPQETNRCLLGPIGVILRSFFPPAGTAGYPLDRSELANKIIQFVAKFGLDHDYVRLGGFTCSLGAERLNFGNHRGKSLREIFLHEKKYCDWALSVLDPYSAEMVELVDYICVNKFWCVPGGRSVKADVELIQLARKRTHNLGPNDDISRWIDTKVAVLRLCMQFYKNRHATSMYFTYTACTYYIFEHLSGSTIEEYPVASSIRGEFVNEVIRPLLRLAEIVPEWKSRISAAILFARAKVCRCSIEAARKDLESTHAIRCL